MEIKTAAQLALDARDSKNLSGLVYTLEIVVREALWPEAKQLGKGADWVNQHPIVSLFLRRIAKLNNYQDANPQWCQDRLAEVRKLAGK